MADLRLEKAEIEDLGAIMALEKSCFKDPWSEGMMRGELEYKNTLFFVLKEESELLGFAALRCILDEGHVMNIAVSEKERGKGYGKILLKGLISAARERGVFHITLEVRAGNEPAINLYKSFHFALEGIRPKYYADGENALIMWLHEEGK